MARTVTLGSLKSQALRRADMENSSFIGNTANVQCELSDILNASAAELYDLLVSSYTDYYVSSQSISILPSTDTYSLPSDFYKLLGVDIVLDSQGNAVTLKPFVFSERNAYLFTPTWNVVGLANLRYHLQGGNIRFVPVPGTSQTVKLWYVPAFASITLDSATFDGIDGWEEYIVVDAAIKMLQKEESDVSVLLAQKEALKKRITDLAVNRDAGAPDRIADVTKQTPYEFMAFGDE